jgi:hypothetical protein
MMKQLFTIQYGIEFDLMWDVSTQEKFMAYVDQKWPSWRSSTTAGSSEQPSSHPGKEPKAAGR